MSDKEKGSMKPPEPSIRRIRAGLEDQIFFWMDSQFDSQNHAVIRFNGQIDEEILEEAGKLALVAEPVLACRYAPALFRQYWEPMALSKAPRLLTIRHAEDDPESIARFLEIDQPIDHLKGPQLHLYLLRAKDHDTLVVKISHVVGDGGAVRDFCYLLSSIYGKRLADPQYRPETNHGSRSLRQVTKNFGFLDMLKIVRRSLRDMKGIFHPFIFQKPSFEPMNPKDRAYEIALIGRGQYQAIREFARLLNVTVNDVVTAAYFRAFYTWVNAHPSAVLRLVITADLRRFLPDRKAATLCGLSGFIYMNIGRDLGETLQDTALLVNRHMNGIKKDYPGLGGSFPMTYLFFKMLPLPIALSLHSFMAGQMKKQYIYPGKIAPLLTNTGVLEKERLTFGEIFPEAVFFSAPLSYPPVFATTITTYEEQMTFCAGFSAKSLPREAVKHFFQSMAQELPNG